MLDLAKRQDGPAKAAQVAGALDAPVSSVQQVLQALNRAGLVMSKSSGNGGYFLARDPRRISLLEIIQAVEGPLDGGRCILRSRPCHRKDVCSLHRVWMEAIGNFADALSRCSLAEVLSDDIALRSGELPVPQDSHRLRSTGPRRS